MPTTVAEVQEAVRAHPVVIRGAGTKSPAAATDRTTLDLSALAGVTEYAPDECVFTAFAGTALRDIEIMLAAKGQYLPFDPPLVQAGATIGGTVATGLSGSCRYRYGGVRDFVIGARIVDGEGRLIRSGGRVVKNAAGFLLHHGMVGSLGRFGVVTELTFKVFPAPEARATLVIERANVDQALRTVRALQQKKFDLEAVDFDATGTMWIRVAGRKAALNARVVRLQREAGGVHLSESDDDRMWREAGEFAWAGGLESLVKIPESRAAHLLPALLGRPDASSALVRYTVGGACAWVATDHVVSLAAQLAAAGLRGLVIRGPHAGTRVGTAGSNPFEHRVQRVLDPRQRFSAAPDPH